MSVRSFYLSATTEKQKMSPHFNPNYLMPSSEGLSKLLATCHVYDN